MAVSTLRYPSANLPAIGKSPEAELVISLTDLRIVCRTPHAIPGGRRGTSPSGGSYRGRRMHNDDRPPRSLLGEDDLINEQGVIAPVEVGPLEGDRVIAAGHGEGRGGQGGVASAG